MKMQEIIPALFKNIYIILYYHCPSQTIKACVQQLTFRMSWGNFRMKILDIHAKNLMKNMLTECLIWKVIPMTLNNKHGNAGRDLIKSATTSLLE